MFFDRTSGSNIFPSPDDGAVAAENPPTLAWVVTPACVRVSLETLEGDSIWTTTTTRNFVIPPSPLPIGTYRWTLSAEGCPPESRTFVIESETPIFLRPTPDVLLANLPAEHPRHLFIPADLPTLRATHAPELEALRRTIQQALADGLPEPPRYHRDPSALPYREYFGRFRDFCDRDLIACALGIWLLEPDPQTLAHARALLLALCDWNPEGPCALDSPWGDEVGLSLARCLPAAFDLLLPYLTPQQAAFVAQTIAAYATQCERRIRALDYTRNPGESHSGRLPAYLGEAALVLWGLPACPVPESTLRRWLSCALDIYGGIFPHYGSPDGAWAEGAFYSTSYTKWFLPFFSLVDRCTPHPNTSFFSRPFYRNVARFFLEFALPDHENHPFGDGYWCSPDSPEWPGFFAQNPFRTYASIAAIPEAIALEKALAAPPLFALHLLDVFLPVPKTTTPAPSPLTDAVAFPSTGFASIHSHRSHPSSDLHILARASKFGPGSHRHADQGAFALFFGGTALLSPSGYFGRQYGTRHHALWTRSSKAHNTLLFDEIGQSYTDFHSTGRILSCEALPDGTRILSLDLSLAHPAISSWIRTLRILDPQTATLEDTITAPHPISVTSCLHTLSRPTQDGLSASLTRNSIRLSILPDPAAFHSLTLSDTFDIDLNDGVPSPYHVSMPPQYHLYLTTLPRTIHSLHTTFRIE